MANKKRILRTAAAIALFGFGVLFELGLPWIGASSAIFSIVCFFSSID